MFEFHLHAYGRNRLGGRGGVHLAPSCAADLAGAAGGETQALERQRSHPVRPGCTYPCERVRDLRVRERLLVLAANAVFG